MELHDQLFMIFKKNKDKIEQVIISGSTEFGNR